MTGEESFGSETEQTNAASGKNVAMAKMLAYGALAVVLRAASFALVIAALVVAGGAALSVFVMTPQEVSAQLAPAVKLLILLIVGAALSSGASRGIMASLSGSAERGDADAE